MARILARHGRISQIKSRARRNYAPARRQKVYLLLKRRKLLLYYLPIMDDIIDFPVF